jgi:cytochrome c551/c552
MKLLTVICLGAAILTLNACGTPAIAVNPYNPGATVAVVGGTMPSSARLVSPIPGMESMPGMTDPTSGAVAAPTAVVTPGPSPTELVIDWLLYGTPTATPDRVVQSPQIKSSQLPVTPTSNDAQNSVSPTVANTQNAEAPTMTLVPRPATQVPVLSSTVPTAATTSVISANVGDPARGQALFQGAATCSSCHDVANGVTIVGPSLKHIASIAESQVPGQDAATRLMNAIMHPNAYVYPDFQPNIMLQTFVQTLSTQQINDLVAYLLTLK